MSQLILTKCNAYLSCAFIDTLYGVGSDVDINCYGSHSCYEIDTIDLITKITDKYQNIDSYSYTEQSIHSSNQLQKFGNKQNIEKNKNKDEKKKSMNDESPKEEQIAFVN